MMDATHRPTDTPEYRTCPDCGELIDWDVMVWLNGRCTCPRCYERRRSEEEIDRLSDQLTE